VDLTEVDKVDLAEQGDEEYCQNCGRPMVLKKGRFGQFFACTGYPDCKTTRPVGAPERKPDVALEEKCPQCGHNLVVKHGRFGEFTACGDYPSASTSSRRPSASPARPASRARSSSAAASAARPSTAATATPTATLSPGPSRWPKPAPSAPTPTWSKSGSKRPTLQCPNADCKFKRVLAPA